MCVCMCMLLFTGTTTTTTRVESGPPKSASKRKQPAPSPSTSTSKKIKKSIIEAGVRVLIDGEWKIVVKGRRGQELNEGEINLTKVREFFDSGKVEQIIPLE